MQAAAASPPPSLLASPLRTFALRETFRRLEPLCFIPPPCASKAPVRRSGGKSGHNRILLDVGEGCMEMRFVANELIEIIALPKLAAAPCQPIDLLRRPAFPPMYDIGETSRFVLRDQCVDMVRHDHIGVQIVIAASAVAQCGFDDFGVLRISKHA